MVHWVRVILSCTICLLPSMASKVCVVTGSNKGIGFEIARKMGAAKYKVVMACRNRDLGTAAADQLRSEGSDTCFEELDIGSSSSIQSFASRVAMNYGKLDVLINNAAIAYKNVDPTPFNEQAEPTIRTNFYGTLELTEALLPLIKKSEAPKIISVASLAGHLKILKSEEKKRLFLDPSLTIEDIKSYLDSFVAEVKAKGTENSWANTCYGMSKLGVIAMTRVLAAREPDVKINCYCPGYCATDMSSHRGHKTPEEGARMALTLVGLNGEEFAAHSGKFYSLDVEAVW